MNLIEAVKSGKRFRRASKTGQNDPDTWIKISPYGVLEWKYWVGIGDSFTYPMCEKDILADDWEVESEPEKDPHRVLVCPGCHGDGKRMAVMTSTFPGSIIRTESIQCIYCEGSGILKVIK